MVHLEDDFLEALEKNVCVHKMNILMFVYLAILAFVLSPGVLLRLPPGAGPTTVAATHALVLSLVYGLTHVMVFRSVK